MIRASEHDVVFMGMTGPDSRYVFYICMRVCASLMLVLVGLVHHIVKCVVFNKFYVFICFCTQERSKL